MLQWQVQLSSFGSTFQGDRARLIAQIFQLSMVKLDESWLPALMSNVESRDHMLEVAASLMERALQERSWDKVRLAPARAWRWRNSDAAQTAGEH